MRALNGPRSSKAAIVQRQEELAVAPRQRAVDHVAALGAVARAGEQRREDARGHREADPLVLPIGWTRPASASSMSVVGRPSRRRPSLGDRQALLLVDLHAADARSRRRRSRAPSGGSSPAGMAIAERIDADELVDAAPGRHGRQRVGRGDADHVGGGGHAHVVLHGAAVVAVAARAATATLVRCARSIACRMAKTPPTWPMLLPPSITSAALLVLGDPRPPLRVDAAFAELADIVRHPHHAMRMDAAQVGHDQLSRPAVRASSAAMPQRSKMRWTTWPSAACGKRRSFSTPGYSAMPPPRRTLS